MTFKEILNIFHATSFTEKDKGTRFERIIRDWFLTDPRYSELEKVWLWDDFPSKSDFGGKDVGIDLVARTEMGDYWAIQCKCYADSTSIDKPAVDSFLATSSRTFKDPETFQTVKFSNRIWVSTTNKWGSNAEEAIANQDPPVTRVNLFDLATSPVEWDKLYNNQVGESARSEGKKTMAHQLEAISSAYRYFEEEKNERGKLIMACGTGKTYTALKLTESILHDKGLVLFLVPSISLLGQTLNAWASDSDKPIKAVCICSDNRASRKIAKVNKYDDTEDTIVDLAKPATTNPNSIKKQLLKYQRHDGLVVVFSTYQSIDVIHEAQTLILRDTNNSFGKFDFIICDEAHRTTGVKLSNKDESNFTRIHDDNYVRGFRRLYMTATPRLYGDSAKVKVKEKDKDCILCSMDDENIYGKEFHRLNFSSAVQRALLTDYKVLVLTVNERDIPVSILSQVKDPNRKELNYDDTSKLIGVINGLSKNVRGDNGTTWDADPRMMRRAVAFCSKIGDIDIPSSSKNIAHILPALSEQFNETLTDEEKNKVVKITTRHIDGSMNSQERNEYLNWLKEDANDPNECRVVTNVRCLSEGVDVPALDAVLFLSARNSQVDVVQSVGRVMRNFRKGQPGEKKYGYIIIPVVVPDDVAPEEALNDNTIFDVVWSILNALRSHDDHFNAIVNSINLNKTKPTKVIIGGAGIGKSVVGNPDDEQVAKTLDQDEVAKQLELRFGELQGGIYAKLVEKCGDRMYWENWAKEIGIIARKLIERITRLVKEGEHKKDFGNFVKGLQENLNPSVDAGQALEMLAQHMITRPVFDALFSEYRFVDNNTVSRSMQHMIELLEDEAIEKDTAVLEKFYESVRINVGNIDNLEGKQTIIKNLYERFFKGAFPLTVEKLGIVYTPVECVDFIIRSVDDILKKDFGTSLTNENVHILDPFTGTGTFITRLLQSGLIKPEDLERKYMNEIHCNEIVLLAYYIADVNIESVFHNITRRSEYLSYNGICLTDTFQLSESNHNQLFTEYFQDNNERVKKQQATPVRVIIGNPPYSVGQRSANDNAQNMSYPNLDSRIADTYAAKSTATLKTSLYDSYIKAFRWASDRISEKEGGIVAFISNGAWLDSNAQDGMRRCLENEFSSIYVLNLRGNQRTSGELSKKEGGKIFGSGSRTPIAITFLVKNPNHTDKARIYYHDIGNYLTREQKLSLIKDFRSISGSSIEWQTIVPNEKGDWINQRDGLFDSLITLGDKEAKNNRFFNVGHTNGLKTQRDAWCYNSSISTLLYNMDSMIRFYNEQCLVFQKAENSVSVNEFINTDPTKISWTSALISNLEKCNTASLQATAAITALYRPYFKQILYCDKQFNERTGIQPKAYPTPNKVNLCIVTSGVGSTKGFSAIITDVTPDIQLNFNGQCYPLYYYEKNKNVQKSLFDDMNSDDAYIRRDGITDWILKEVRSRFSGAKNLTKEHIFYYVYGLLHCHDYRVRFADDLRKSLPRIPIVNNVEDFMAFYRAGKDLAELHLNYDKCLTEEIAATDRVDMVQLISHIADTLQNEYGVTVTGDNTVYKTAREIPGQETDFDQSVYDFYRVEKMKFPKKGERDTIIYNSHIRIENIPEKAYEYVVNGKSAIEWILERYCINIDKVSGIKNDCNDWAQEHKQPRYILDLILSIINVSCKTVDIVNGLPRMKFE
ncbi:MAG: DEAD/DEAH box helicase [Bacteroides cellulosilyticus]|uniref:DEAD/DEAH box helicase n=1 Tax=Bacteroides cellulosilyticus TaxID=246787 RepID=UPI0029547F3F|nr:type ISP restriction/modification enzyme [Bacteroides cellulosilyticus]MBS5700891.1 DEAD/DEAH box helicase [Bacteroides cellulosilyticus]MDV7047822.1 type ISP restriction/modification enzyme [Bacteroides cellulosilyticus]